MRKILFITMNASDPCKEEYPQYFWVFNRKLYLKKVGIKKIIN